MKITTPGSLLAALFILSASAATAQETRTPCPSGTTTFAIEYGGYFECSMPAPATHNWEFNAVTGEVVGLHMVRLAGTGLPCLRMFDPGGFEVVSNLCETNLVIPATRNSVLMQSTGKYKITVYESGSIFDSFQYSFNLERLAPPTASALLLEPGQVVTSSINPVGDRDLYRFRVNTGDQYSFNLTKLSGTGTEAMYFIDTVGAATRIFDGTIRTAAIGGTVGLWVAQLADSGIQEYRLQFNCATCPRTFVEPPSAPSPATGAILVPQNVTLSWTENQNVDSFDVYFGTAISPPFLTNTTAKSYTPTTLNIGTTYYWKVVAKVGAATSVPTVFSFTTIPPIVETPSLPNPANGAIGVARNLLMSWTENQIVDSFDVYFGTSNPPPLVATAFTKTYPPPTLAFNATYYWRVEAKLGIGRASTQVFSFTTLPATIEAPSAPVPATGSTNVSRNVTLSWTDSQTVNSFDVYFGTGGAPSLVANTTAKSYTPPTLAAGTTYFWSVTAKLGGATASSPLFSFTTTDGSGNTTGRRFVPVSPCRLVDTREASLGAFGTPALAGNAIRSFAIPQRAACNIPANASAYSLNVTVVPKEPLGFLTIFPTGANQPFVSTLNSLDGRIKANAAIVPAGTNGAVSVYVTNSTELILDINGYFIDPLLNAQSLSFYPLTPCRIIDTRIANGQLGGPSLAAGVGRDIPVLASNCGIPASAQAYSLNATGVPPAGLGFLTLWPTGQQQPFVSTLNAPTGAITANAAIVPVGTNGSIAAFASSATHLILDINGYFAPPGGSNAQRFFTAVPCRLLDTRTAVGEFGGPILEGAGIRNYRLPLGNCGLPDTAAAFSLNATVVPVSSLGFLTLWPAGSAQPLVSTLNALDGAITSNAAIVPAGSLGGVSSFVTNQTHLILDTNGYFAP